MTARSFSQENLEAYGGATAIDISTTDHSARFNGLWVGGAGNVKVDMLNGDAVTFNSVAAGTLLKIAIKKVYKTGTTATNMVGLK